MPKTKPQKLVFGFLMASVMVYGMEVYNTAIAHGGMTNQLFAVAPGEFFLLIAIVMALQVLAGGPLAKQLASRVVDFATAKPLAVTVSIQVMTVCVMCPLMSMVATLLFKRINSQIPANWAQAVVVNFPMALCWQLLIAGPLVRMIYTKIWKK